MPNPFERQLLVIARRGAERASEALARWLGRPVHLTVSEARQVDLAEATTLLGPEDDLLACSAMAVRGRIAGQLLLIFEDRAGFDLVDLLLNRPPGTAHAWGELERSAAQETANIVGCAYLNALAEHLPAPEDASGPEAAALWPSPPDFRHEFAASLLEFALMDQAMGVDRPVLVWARFASAEGGPGWSLLLVPGAPSVRELTAALGGAANP